MKILICTHTYLPDVNGVAQAVNFQYRLLKELGHEVDILTSHRYESSPNVSFSFNITGTGRLLDKFSGQVGEYLDFLENSKFDFVFFHCWETWVTEIPLRLKNINFKMIIFSHGTSHSMNINSIQTIIRRIFFFPFYITFAKRMFFFHHYVFLTGMANSDRFMDKLFFDKFGLKNFSIIPNLAIVNSDISTIKFKQKFSLPDKNIILFVSNFSKSKGQDIALRAFKELNPENHILLFIGSIENDFSNKLKKEAEGLLNKSIFFLTGLNKLEIDLAYADSDFFIFCSQTEAQPLVILDSIAHKLPFISSNVGCIGEIKGGLVYNDYNDFKNKLEILLKDSVLKYKLSVEGFEDFIYNYSFVSVKEKYSLLLKKLAS